MEENVTIQVHRGVCVIEPQLMTITPRFKTGTKIIVSRVTGDIVSQDILLGLGVSTKRRITLHDIVRVVGRRIEGEFYITPQPFTKAAPYFYQILITTRAGDTFTFVSIVEPWIPEQPKGSSNARKDGDTIVRVLRKWADLPVKDDSTELVSGSLNSKNSIY